MLSVFPELFTFSFLAVGVFRVIVGLICINLGVTAWKTEQDLFGLAQAVAGGILVVGLFTQPAVLTLAALYIEDVRKKEQRGALYSRQLYVLLIASLFALLFVGPGAFALDVPF